MAGLVSLADRKISAGPRKHTEPAAEWKVRKPRRRLFGRPQLIGADEKRLSKINRQP